jgi:hypothetical protein
VQGVEGPLELGRGATICHRQLALFGIRNFLMTDPIGE